MLIQEGEARASAKDRRLAGVLAAVAGALNAAAFHAVGFFSANMTGNLSALSDRLAVGAWGAAGFFLSILAAFVAGSTLSALMISAGRRRRLGGVYAYSILLEAALLAVVGLLDLRLEGQLRVAVLVNGLSFLMGLQNAAVTRISNARVRTTHVSGMLTDIGIGLSHLVDMARGREPDAGRQDTLAKLSLHLATVAAFFAGGVAGVLLYDAMGGVLMFVVAAVLLLVALPAALRTRGKPGAAANSSSAP